MAFANDTRTSTPSGIALEISAAVHHAVQAIADYRAYRATLAELRRLDARALADLGLHRSGIRATAHQAVYGTRH